VPHPARLTQLTTATSRPAGSGHSAGSRCDLLALSVCSSPSTAGCSPPPAPPILRNRATRSSHSPDTSSPSATTLQASLAALCCLPAGAAGQVPALAACDLLLLVGAAANCPRRAEPGGPYGATLIALETPSSRRTRLPSSSHAERSATHATPLMVPGTVSHRGTYSQVVSPHCIRV